MIKNEYLKKIDDLIAEGPYDASWDSLEGYAIPQWYKDAKFGIFIHWGVYSVPAFGTEWYPRNMYKQGSKEFNHHVKTYGPQKEFGYKDFIPMFQAEKFDPEEWAELFKASGAKFVMPVGEHHDGFQMYRSEVSPWNSAKMGPKRDVCGELANRTRELGMKFSISSHRAEHWWFMGGGREFDSDVNDPELAGLYGPAVGGRSDNGDQLLHNSPSQDFLEDWLVRTCEMVDRFHPAIVWFDWWIQNLAFIPYLKKFAAYYYNHAAKHGYDPAINYKYEAYPIKTAVFDVERGQLKGARGLLWQTDTAVQKNSWGYTENQDYKTPQDIICDLVDIVSKNGALLLNVGPKADGTIPEPEKEILRAIGRWLAVNGEAIYNTTYMDSFGEGPTKIAEGAFTDTKRSAFTSRDMRFTKGSDAMYVTVLSYPEDRRATIESLKSGSKLIDSINKVELLGSDDEVKFSRSERGLAVELPKYDANGYPVVLKIF